MEATSRLWNLLLLLQKSFPIWSLQFSGLVSTAVTGGCYILLWIISIRLDFSCVCDFFQFLIRLIHNLFGQIYILLCASFLLFWIVILCRFTSSVKNVLLLFVLMIFVNKSQFILFMRKIITLICMWLHPQSIRVLSFV